MSEIIRIRKEEWEDFRKDVEIVVKHYNESLEKIKELTSENTTIRDRLKTAESKLASAEQKAASDLQQTSQAILKLRTEISRALQQTKKET